MAVLFYSSVMAAEPWRDALLAREPGLDFRIHPAFGAADEIDCLLAWRPPSGTFARLPRLKLIYCTGAGVDQLFSDPELPADLPIARLVDPDQGNEMAAYVMAVVLARHRELERLRDQQRAGVWQMPPYRYVTDLRIGVMGLGALGALAASRLALCGFPVAGWSRGPKQVAGVESFVGADGLGPFLARTDMLVCLLPLTPETNGILNAALFRQLPPGAYVVNAARGHHVVDADLIASLDSGHLAGATLDVFRTEPLPASHPFWAHPKIAVTPHVASLAKPDSVAEQILDNLGRLARGAPLLNQVDRQAGY
ncbi:MAG: glyoxylate/hydroxypyruvate reductase A [Pseudomonadota bacterium]